MLDEIHTLTIEYRLTFSGGYLKPIYERIVLGDKLRVIRSAALVEAIQNEYLLGRNFDWSRVESLELTCTSAVLTLNTTAGFNPTLAPITVADDQTLNPLPITNLVQHSLSSANFNFNPANPTFATQRQPSLQQELEQHSFTATGPELAALYQVWVKQGGMNSGCLYLPPADPPYQINPENKLAAYLQEFETVSKAFNPSSDLDDELLKLTDSLQSLAKGSSE